MIAWWDGLTGLQQVFAAIAVPATVILFLQTLMLLFGLGMDYDGDFSSDHDGDASSDHDGPDPGLRIFTVRGFIAFFTMFGWAGLVCVGQGMGKPLSFLIAAAAGIASMVVIAIAFLGILKLQSDGTMDINTVKGSPATVYIPVPAERNGFGKVSLVVSGRLSEFEACTDHKKELETNDSVEVIDIINGNKLVVMPVSKK